MLKKKSNRYHYSQLLVPLSDTAEISLCRYEALTLLPMTTAFREALPFETPRGPVCFTNPATDRVGRESQVSHLP